MGRKYTTSFYGERIYLDDILQINFDRLKKGARVSVEFVSTHFVNKKDNWPIFWYHLYFDDFKSAKCFFEKMKKRITPFLHDKIWHSLSDKRYMHHRPGFIVDFKEKHQPYNFIYNN